MTFANTSYTHQGETLEAGTLVAMVPQDGYDTAVVLGFSGADKHGDVWVKLGRPYAYASGTGTSCPTVLVGCETYEVLANHLFDTSRFVLGGSGCWTR
jgi:hypothetical protein